MAQSTLTSISKPISPQPAAAQLWPRLGMRWGLLAGLMIVLAFMFTLSLALGSVSIPLSETLAVLFGGEPTRTTWKTIIMDFRLPGALTAVFAGAALSVAGLQMQTLFRNPLADPFVLGVSSGASLGVALVVLSLGTASGAVLLAGIGLLEDFTLAAASSLGAALVMALVLVVARYVRSSMTLLILGVMFGYTTGGIVSLLMYFGIADRVRLFITWTFGSFNGVTWGQMWAFIPVVTAGLIMAFMLSKPLNALLLGETYARSMGLNTTLARKWIIISTALLAGAVTAFCGPIGFVGIAVPHLCRSLFNTSDHRVLIPASILMGGIVALVADLIAQLPANQVTLPLNAVTALLGAPLVIWIILRQRRLAGALLF